MHLSRIGVIAELLLDQFSDSQSVRGIPNKDSRWIDNRRPISAYGWLLQVSSPAIVSTHSVALLLAWLMYAKT